MAVMKLAIGHLDLYLFNAIRLTLSGLVLGGCVVWESRYHRASLAQLSTPPSRVWFILQVVLFSILTGAVYQIVFAIGMSKTTAGNTALIMSSMPMWTALIAFVALREKLGAAWAGLTLAFCGTVVVTLEKGFDFSNATLVGNSIVLASALAWAAAAVVSRSMMKYTSPIRLAFFATMGTLPLHFLAVPLLGGESQTLVTEGWMVACILYSGIFSTGLAYAMWNFGVQQIGPSQASVYQNLVPLIALVAAMILLKESVSMIQMVGGGLIIGGLVLTRRWRSQVVSQAPVETGESA